MFCELSTISISKYTAPRTTRLQHNLLGVFFFLSTFFFAFRPQIPEFPFPATVTCVNI
uniref:Uncharacterized protein n=1 Tax=Anguilla anguilla TaxID=7936 RepID=A0A0E9RVW3_ANGAN